MILSPFASAFVFFRGSPTLLSRLHLSAASFPLLTSVKSVFIHRWLKSFGCGFPLRVLRVSAVRSVFVRPGFGSAALRCHSPTRSQAARNFHFPIFLSQVFLPPNFPATLFFSLDTIAPICQTAPVVSEIQNRLTNAALNARSRGESNPPLPSLRPKINHFQAQLLCAMALGIGSSFTLAAATFTDANWTSTGGIRGADSTVFPAAVDASGNLYIGGDFAIAGDVLASRVAKWIGSSWSALGSGMSGAVWALAVSGDYLYAGGTFTTAGGSAANHVAKWDGNAWSALGSGMNNSVSALAPSGSDLCAGGSFTMTGGSGANYVAKWDGSSWSALGSGLNS